MKRITKLAATFVAAIAVLAALAAAAWAWVSPTPKTITCNAATFAVAAGNHEATPWLYAIDINGLRAEQGTAMDTATRYQSGSITVSLASVMAGANGATKHVVVTVNGPEGYADGGARIGADLTCGQAPPTTVVDFPAQPSDTPAPLPAAQQPAIGTPYRAEQPKVKRRHRRHPCYGLRVAHRYKHGPRKGQRFTLCVKSRPVRVPHFAG